MFVFLSELLPYALSCFCSLCLEFCLFYLWGFIVSLILYFPLLSFSPCFSSQCLIHHLLAFIIVLQFILFSICLYLKRLFITLLCHMPCKSLDALRKTDLLWDILFSFRINRRTPVPETQTRQSFCHMSSCVSASGNLILRNMIRAPWK
jgi:hypothetical protein